MNSNLDILNIIARTFLKTNYVFLKVIYNLYNNKYLPIYQKYLKNWDTPQRLKQITTNNINKTNDVSKLDLNILYNLKQKYYKVS